MAIRQVQVFNMFAEYNKADLGVKSSFLLRKAQHWEQNAATISIRMLPFHITPGMTPSRERLVQECHVMKDECMLPEA